MRSSVAALAACGVAAAFYLQLSRGSKRGNSVAAAKTSVPIKKAVFLNAHHAGHFNPTVELVRIMVSAGIEVHYFATANLRSVIETAGAIFHNYGTDSWSLSECALQGCVALGCKPSEEMKSEFLLHQLMVATLELLPFLIEEMRKINPCVVVSDSSYPWGVIPARILGIPMVCSCSAAMMPKEEQEAVFSMLRGLDFNVKAKAALADKYCIDYDPVNSYCNYSDFTISWCHPKFLGVNVDTQDPRCHFFGASLPMPPSDKEAVVQAAIAQIMPEPDGFVFPLAELKKKADAGERVIYISMGTVMGTEPWTFGMLGSFYQNVFDAFDGISGVTVVVAIGKVIKVKDLPPAPANYIVRNSVPQKELLLISTLFFTHNGMNSTNEALFAGVPMVCMPCFGDQHFNAARVEALEIGVHLKSPFAPDPPQNIDHLSSTALKAAAEEIFADYARFKTKCGEMKREMYGLCEYLHKQALSDLSEWAAKEAPRQRASVDAMKQGVLIKA